MATVKTSKNPERIFILASYAESLVNFRGELIHQFCSMGFEVHAAAPSLTGGEEVAAWLSSAGVTCHDIPMNRGGLSPIDDIRTAVEIFMTLKKVKPNIVFSYTIKPVIWGTIVSSLAGVPSRIALISGLGYAFTGAATGRRRFVQIVARLLYKLALSRANLVFFQNPDDQRTFLSLNLLADDAPVAIINGSGVDTDRFCLAPLPSGPFTFLMIARLLRDKGIEEYFEAAQIVRETHPDVCFQLVGDLDPNPNSLTERELRNWLEKSGVKWLGPLTDVRPAIAASHVYVLPSYREGTPRTVLEAMSMGRPVITTDAPGCRETVRQGETGFLVPIRDSAALARAMKIYIESPDLIEKTGKEGRRLAESRFDVRIVNASILQAMNL